MDDHGGLPKTISMISVEWSHRINRSDGLAMIDRSIHNFTANPKMRKDFVVSIDQTAPVETAQQAALEVLCDHPAILGDPEPTVLVDALAGDKVNLRVYFWVDSRLYSDLKVLSSAIRLVTAALQKAKILPSAAERPGSRTSTGQATPHANTATATAAEGDLRSDASDLHAQAREAPLPTQGTNLLTAGTNGASG
jgi:small conductance mechanosensitive channel